MSVKSLLLLCIVCLTMTIDQPSFEELAKNVVSYHQDYPQEKIYLMHDKPYYVLGEDLWFSIYLRHAGDHGILTPSGLVYVELVSPLGNSLITRNIKITDGAGHGDFPLDPNWKQEGTFTIRAFTQYQQNFASEFIFEKQISILDSYQKIVTEQNTPQTAQASDPGLRIDFYPEGGDLITGLKSTVAVQTQTTRGEGKAVKAKIFDRNNQLVTLFITNERGYGSFSLTPTPNMRYRLELVDAPAQPPIILPEAKEMGMTLRVQNKLADTLIIRAESTLPEGLKDAFILGHQRGKLLIANKFLEGKAQTLLVPTDSFSNGIAHITLFSPEGLPIAERLTYVRQKRDIVNLDIAELDRSYSKRQPIKIAYKLSGNGHLEGILSATVFDQILATRPAYQSDISTYLWLSSDLPGIIADPGYYLQPGRQNSRDLDLLLLTHGWRRFQWEEISNPSAFTIKFLPENGFSVKGTTTRYLSEKKPTAANVFLSSMGTGFQMMQAEANDEGEFAFRDLQINDTTTLVLQGNRIKAGNKASKETVGPSDKNKVNIFIDEPAYPNFKQMAQDFSIRPDQSVLSTFLAESRLSTNVDAAYSDLWSIDLAEVVVRGQQVSRDVAFHQKSMLYKEPDQRLMLDSVPWALGKNNIFDVINGRFPGVEIIGSYPNKTARIRGINSISLETTATILLDGAPVSDVTANTIPVDRIAFVDVIKGFSKSAIYGRNNGVIAIYTKAARGGSRVSSGEGVLNMEHPGYYQAREFLAGMIV